MSADWVLTAVHSDPRCESGDQWFEFTGAGEGTDLGACMLYAAHCTRAAEPPNCTSWYDGVWSITTEDGDVINITFDGRWLEPGRASQGVDVMTVVGGTGRFDGAAGEMEGDLYPDWSEWPPTLTIRQTIRGWISY
jgi:hypothetical protein